VIPDRKRLQHPERQSFGIQLGKLNGRKNCMFPIKHFTSAKDKGRSACIKLCAAVRNRAEGLIKCQCRYLVCLDLLTFKGRMHLPCTNSQLHTQCGKRQTSAQRAKRSRSPRGRTPQVHVGTTDLAQSEDLPALAALRGWTREVGDIVST
jgi:hypothetical protein